MTPKSDVSTGQVGTSLSQERQVELYRAMQLIRRTEELLMEEYHPADEMRCPVHFCVGQEATPASLSLLLRPEDVVMSHHRSHGYYLAKGAPLEAMVAEFYGKSTGSNGGLAGSQELSHDGSKFYSGTILSGMFAIAAGDAFAARYTNDGHITIAVIGDGGFEEGIVYETLNFASRFSLPVLFLCENNLFSAHTHIDVRATSRTVTDRVAGFGIRPVVVDGNDPLETYERLSEMVGGIRAGEGPAFAEVVTYRTCGHVGPEDDDHLGYRSQEELLKWQQRDPVAFLQRVLLDGGVQADTLDQITAEIDKVVAGAITAAKDAPVPSYAAALEFNRTDSYDPLVKDLVEDLVSPLDPHQAETKLKPY